MASPSPPPCAPSCGRTPTSSWVGRFRDYETAEIAVRRHSPGTSSSHAAHQRRPSTVTRLLNMGIEPSSCRRSLNLVVAQRLARRVCMKCQGERCKIPGRGGGRRDEARAIRLAKPAKGRACDELAADRVPRAVRFIEVDADQGGIKDLVLRGGSALDLQEGGGPARMKFAPSIPEVLTKLEEVVTTLEECCGVTAPD